MRFVLLLLSLVLSLSLSLSLSPPLSLFLSLSLALSRSLARSLFLALFSLLFSKTLVEISKFRQFNRLPILSYIHPKTRAPLFVAAQPLVGSSGNRCYEDERESYTTTTAAAAAAIFQQDRSSLMCRAYFPHCTLYADVRTYVGAP